MFKNLFAKFGKGAAKIDLILDQEDYALGDEIHGEIKVYGGTIQQKINKIEVDLNMDIHVGESVYTQLIHRFEIQESFEIQPDEEKSFPFYFQIPYNLLISGNTVSYYFITHLDIDSGKDSSDRDRILIHPHSKMQNIFTALNQLGFIESHSSRAYDGYFQEFDFVPTTQFKNEIEEIEFNVISQEDGILVLFEVDCYSFLGEKEISQELWLDNDLLADIDALASHLQSTLEKMVQEPSLYHGEKEQFRKKYYLAAGAVGGVAVGLIAAEAFKEALEDVGDFIEDMIDDDDDDDDDNIFFDDDDEGVEASFFDDEEDD